MNNQMPSVKELLIESWEAFKASLGNLFIISLLGSVLGIVVLVVILLGIAGMGFLSALYEIGGSQQDVIQKLQTFLTPERLLLLGVVSTLLLIGGAILSSIFKLAIILAVGKYKEKPSVSSCLKGGMVYFVPVLVMSVVAWFITFGSWFVFVIPGIIIGLFLQFASYEIILGGKKWFRALKGSVQIMSQHFGEVLLRMVFLALVIGLGFQLPIYLLEIVVAAFSEGASAQAFGLVLFLNSIKVIVGMFVGFYSIVYGVITYQQAKRATTEDTNVSMAWMFVVSLVGWLIVVLIGGQLIKIGKSQLFQNGVQSITNEVKVNTTIEMTEQEKIANWKSLIKPEAKVFYDESMMFFQQMKSVDVKPTKIKSLNDTNIKTIKKALEIDSDNPELWATLADSYTWINSTGTLNDALNASKKSEDLDGSIWGYAFRTAGILELMGNYDEAVIK